MVTKNLDYIDSLRALAILGVIIVHSNQYGRSNMPDFIQGIISQGARGVQLFYVASAFTLFLSFNNRKGDEVFPIRNFFIRRFFRIAPMYYLGIFYYLLQDGFGPRYWLCDANEVSNLNIIANATFIHGLNPYWITSVVPGGWSIAVETTFYLILPLLFIWIKNLNQAVNFFIFSVFLKALLSYIFMGYPLINCERLWEEYLYFYFPNQLPIFSLGIIFYFMIKGNNKLSGKSIFLLVCIGLFQLTTGLNIFIENFILFGIAFLGLGIALSKYKPKLIINPIISHIGKISYSMYLVHFAVLYWLTYFKFIDYFEKNLLNYATRFIIVTILSILISTLLYYTIEIPFQKIGKKIINRMQKKYELRN